jgi:hypothetical protein
MHQACSAGLSCVMPSIKPKLREQLSADDVDAYNRIHYEVWKIPVQVFTAPPSHPQVSVFLMR